jgi:transposase InsO family protein
VPGLGLPLDAGPSGCCGAASEHCRTSRESGCGTPASAGEASAGGPPAACRARGTSAPSPPSSRRSRRVRAQRARRRAEEQARHRAVLYAEQLAVQRVSYSGAAVHLQIAPRTLQSWKAGRGTTGRPPEPRGRPPLEVDVATRNEVVRFLHQVTGPAIGLPALQALFRQVPRCILEDLLRRYRKVWRRRYAQHGFELTWHSAGAVWAIDFTQAREPIDGVFPYLLAIRDLASHCQLAWRPIRSEAVADVLPTLRELFAEYGPPLVLKSDNGSAFIAELLHALLGEAQVAQLFSPSHQPKYNGALERNNGVLKVYTHQHAVSAGHAFRWTAEDVEHAQQLANTISRPWGARGPSPEEAWRLRPRISAQERQAFLAAVEAHRVEAARELALDLAADLSVADRARLDRLAISGALQELGYLTMKRRGHVERPKRWSREKLAERVDEYRGGASGSESPAAENSPPAPRPQRTSAVASDSGAGLLASSAPSDILLAASPAATEPQVLTQDIPSAQRERTFTSWLRRAFTPLLQFCKTAKISQ